MTVNATENNPPTPQIPPRTRAPRREVVKPEQFYLPAWTHPEVLYWYDDWKLIRDVIDGEKEVKRERTRYLPQLEAMDAADYDAYVKGATFYPFTGRTVKAMTGSIFKRRPVLQGMPANLMPRLRTITLANNAFGIHAKLTAREILSMGRFGVLIDYPQGNFTDPQPYLASYTAENILDWDIATDPVTGRQVLARLVLREFTLGRDSELRQRAYARYRVYTLTEFAGERGKVCVVRIFERHNEHAELKEEFASSPVVVRRRGVALDFIPFRGFGTSQSEMTVEIPPILDIARMNISHYRSYAHLEHGRFYTGFPIYTVQGDTQGGEAGYEIGPSRVWTLPPQADAKILEFNGQGLKHLENALEIKESQAAALGGRMIGVVARSVSESDNQTKMKERNEQSILLDVSQSLDEGYTQVLRWWAWMAGASKEDADRIEVEFNKDFVFDLSGAREFRAIHAMFKDGVIPVEVLYDYLRKHEVVPDWMSAEEFKSLLQQASSFPGQEGDFLARQLGFPDKKTQLEDEHFKEELEAEEKTAQLAQTRAFNSDPANRGRPPGSGGAN